MQNKRYNLLSRIRDFIILGFLLKIFFALNKRRPVIPKTLAIIKLDGIGDYILFRNFIKTIRESEKFKEYKITLCGNIIWRELAESFDKEYLDDFVWIDKVKFRSKLSYKLSALGKLLNRRFEMAIHPTYSRDMLADTIARSAGTNNLIGHKGDTLNLRPAQKKITDAYYTRLIDTGDKGVFEFLRNKKFMEMLLEKRLDVDRPQLDVSRVAFEPKPDEPFAVLFPGASHKTKMWDTKNFAAIADHLHSKYNYAIVVCGSENERPLAELIMKRAQDAKIIIMNSSSLPKLGKILSRARIIITNDTGAMHMGVAVGTRVVCISSGISAGRYTPYPKFLCDKCATVYPPGMPELSNDQMEKVYEQYQYGTNFNINSIQPSEVIKHIDLLLSKNF